MTTLEIAQIPCLSDNYGYLLHDPESGQTACIDTPDPAPILAMLEANKWRLSHIWNTHHHWDHAGNNLEVKEKTDCTIIGPFGEADKIPGIDQMVDEGDTITLGNHQVQILNVGGHTLGHIAYYLPDDGLAFVGDSLFVLGCGRVFEGTMAQMWASLSKLAALPPATTIYCAHEYTSSNAAFAIEIDPDNTDLQKRVEEIAALRAADKPTVPTNIELELATNPFLRAGDASIRAHLDMAAASDLEVFAEIRARKDKF